MTRVVITHYRYKRPPRKRKAVAVEVPVIVTAKSSSQPSLLAAPAAKEPRHEGSEAARPAAASSNPKPALVVATSRKRSRLLRAERWLAAPREPTPEVEAFFARNVRRGGPQPPRKP